MERDIVVLCGNIQFRFPDGICDLYWFGINGVEKEKDEDWHNFCIRNGEVVKSQLKGLDDNRIIKEALEWPFIKNKYDNGVQILDYLYMVLVVDRKS